MTAQLRALSSRAFLRRCVAALLLLLAALPGVISVPAAALVRADAAYRERSGADNPNTGLIAALQGAGVDIHVCSQAMAGNNIAPDAVNPAITIDLSAITTLVLLQQQGWPVISD